MQKLPLLSALSSLLHFLICTAQFTVITQVDLAPKFLVVFDKVSLWFHTVELDKIRPKTIDFIDSNEKQNHNHILPTFAS